jgi:iron complex outermembrane receptor protein
MPSARLAWRASANSLVWASVSRAVRTPSRFDRDLYNGAILQGGPAFASETLIAYEAGYKTQASERFWFSLSAFYNDYDDLRTLEATSPAVYPLEVRNGMEGETYGLEGWGSLTLTDWWRLNAGFATLHKELRLKAGSADVFGVGFAGNDPDYSLSLRSLVDLSARARFDLSARYVDELPAPYVPSYTNIDIRLSYRLTDHLELALLGYNLIDDGRLEFINPSLPPRQNARSFFFSARWRQ